MPLPEDFWLNGLAATSAFNPTFFEIGPQPARIDGPIVNDEAVVQFLKRVRFPLKVEEYGQIPRGIR